MHVYVYSIPSLPPFLPFPHFYIPVCMGVKCFNIPSAGEWTNYTTIGQYLLGLFLVWFTKWAKVDAFRCIGTYCWFWGDFFYRRNVNLTFNGIYEIFPHPMYTVGYTAFYGWTLICRSYPMLFAR